MYFFYQIVKDICIRGKAILLKHVSKTIFHSLHFLNITHNFSNVLPNTYI